MDRVAQGSDDFSQDVLPFVWRGPEPDYCRAIRSTLIRSSKLLSAAITLS
jgi:hypothetical protein